MISLKERLQEADRWVVLVACIMGCNSDACRRVPLTAEASELIWGHCIRLVNRTFVEG